MLNLLPTSWQLLILHLSVVLSTLPQEGKFNISMGDIDNNHLLAGKAVSILTHRKLLLKVRCQKMRVQRWQPENGLQQMHRNRKVQSKLSK